MPKGSAAAPPITGLGSRSRQAIRRRNQGGADAKSHFGDIGILRKSSTGLLTMPRILPSDRRVFFARFALAQGGQGSADRRDRIDAVHPRGPTFENWIASLPPIVTRQQPLRRRHVRAAGRALDADINLVADTGHPLLALFTVLAVMLFPDNEAKREELIQESSTVRITEGPEIARRSLSASMTGLVLVRIRTLAATDLRERALSRSSMIWLKITRGSRNVAESRAEAYWRMWKSNRPVAHLCASYFFFGPSNTGARIATDRDSILSTPRRFLFSSRAPRAYRQWGE